MSLFEDGKVIIEVGLNERTTKVQNPNVPYGIDEVTADSVACARAGAAVVHFHARTDQGAQVWDGAAVYRRAMECIARECDVLTYPSYNATFDHIVELLDAPPKGAPLHFVPFDVFQSVGLVNWDEAARRFIEIQIEWMPGASKGDRPAILGVFEQHGCVPTVCVQELGDLRWTQLAVRAGLLAPPVALKLFVMGKYVRGPEPTPAGLDAMLTHVNNAMEPMVVPSRMVTADSTEALLRHAIARRAHIRVGIGDNPEAYPRSTNRELVERAVELVQAAGFEPAAVDDVRRFFPTRGPGRP